MAGYNSNKNKHLAIEDRMEMQLCLDRGMTFKAIAARVGKDQTTISKEVKKHITIKEGEIITRTDLKGTPKVQPPCPRLLKGSVCLQRL